MASPPPSSAADKKPSSDKKQKTPKPVKVKPVARVKGPLDLDKQCGVIVAPGNTPCARSLTCKSHSMSSKRSVEGRSRPYDVLLSMIQKKPATGMNLDMVLYDLQEVFYTSDVIINYSLLFPHSER